MTELQICLRTWRHVKTERIYRVICCALNEKDKVPVVVYEGEAAQGTGGTWVRPRSEFLDGRFQWQDQTSGEWVTPKKEPRHDD